MRSWLGTSKLVSTWILVTLGVSIASTLTGGWVGDLLVLAPARVGRGEVWRLATWILVERDPWSLLLTCVAIYKFGGELEQRWGARRLQRVVMEIVLGAAALTVLVGLVADDAWYLRRAGGWALGDLLVIAWARTFPERVLVFYQFVTVRSRDAIRLCVAVTFIYALFAGPLRMLPEVLTCAGAVLYPRARWRR